MINYFSIASKKALMCRFSDEVILTLNNENFVICLYAEGTFSIQGQHTYFKI